jgi:hypothetical protein
MPEYDGPDRRNNNGWMFNKSVGVSHLATTFLLVAGGFNAWSNLDKQVLENRLAHVALVQTVERNQQWNTSVFGEIKTMLKEMSVKIDRLGERRAR